MPSDDLLKYYVDRSDKRFDALEEKVDRLLALRWMLIGAASGASVIVTVLIEVAKAVAGGK